MTTDFRLYLLTWNVGESNPPQDLTRLLGLDGKVLPNLYAVGLQEMRSTTADLVFEDNWTAAITDCLSTRNYIRIKTRRLNGIHISVYGRKVDLPYITNVESECTKTGLGGLWGNKGALSIRLSVFGVNLCIVVAHYAAHSEYFRQRIEDYNLTLETQKFRDKDCETILDHDYVFWMGDLNFRIDGISNEEVRKRVKDNDLTYLSKYDQLSEAIKEELIFIDFLEGPLTFAPTFKFDVGTDDYDTSAKNRVPSWCDRILWRVHEDSYEGVELSVEQLSYASITDQKTSDHRPVFGEFTIQVLKSPSELPVMFEPIGCWCQQKDNEVSYLVSSDLTLHSRDWIGLYRDGYKNWMDYVTYVWASGKGEDMFDGSHMHSVLFETRYLQRLPSDTYYLLYFSFAKNCVVGYSDGFRIVSTEESSSSETDEGESIQLRTDTPHGSSSANNSRRRTKKSLNRYDPQRQGIAGNRQQRTERKREEPVKKRKEEEECWKERQPRDEEDGMKTKPEELREPSLLTQEPMLMEEEFLLPREEPLIEEPLIKEPLLRNEPLIEELLPRAEPLIEKSLIKETLLRNEPLIEEPLPREEPLIEEPLPRVEPLIEEPLPRVEPLIEEPLPRVESLIEETLPREEPLIEEPLPREETLIEEPLIKEPLLRNEPLIEEPLPKEEPLIEEPLPREEPLIEEPLIKESLLRNEPLIEEPLPKEEPLIEEPLPREETLIEEPLIKEPLLRKEPLIKEPLSKEEPLIEEPLIKEPLLRNEPLIDEPLIKEASLRIEPLIKEPLTKEPLLINEPLTEEPLPKEEPLIEEPLPREEPLLRNEPLIDEPLIKEASLRIEPLIEEPLIKEPLLREQLLNDEPLLTDHPLINESLTRKEPLIKEPLRRVEPLSDGSLPREEQLLREEPLIEEHPMCSEPKQPLLSDEPVLCDIHPMSSEPEQLLCPSQLLLNQPNQPLLSCHGDEVVPLQLSKNEQQSLKDHEQPSLGEQGPQILTSAEHRPIVRDESETAAAQLKPTLNEFIEGRHHPVQREQNEQANKIEQLDEQDCAQSKLIASGPAFDGEGGSGQRGSMDSTVDCNTLHKADNIQETSRK